MIEPLDFSKYEMPEFPHFTRNAEAILDWHKLYAFVEGEFRADLADYIMNYLAIELNQDSLYMGKIQSVIDIAMDWEEDWEKAVELAVRMLPLIIEDKV